MFKPIPGNHEFLISKDGEFKSRYLTANEVGCTPIIQDGKVKIEFFNEFCELSIEWVALIAHYEVDFPNVRDYDNILFMDGRMFFRRPIEPVKGLRTIPGYTRYLVTKMGDVYDTVEEQYLVKQEHKRRGRDWYTRVSVYDPAKNRRRYMVLHRLVALAWVHNPDPLNKIHVNHKDGNKRNPHYKNLEWVTPTENSIHAVRTGLRNDNIPCKIRDAQTGTVKEYTSLNEAAAGLGIDVGQLAQTFRRIRKNKLFNNRYELKSLDDESPWVHENGIKKAGRYITTVTSPTGEVEVFNDTRDVVKRFKLWNLRSNSIANILERMARDYPDHEVHAVDQYDTRPIQAMYVPDRKVMETPTIRAMSKLTGLDHRCIRRRVVSPTIHSVDGYAYRYKTDESWPEVIEPLPSKSKCILATHADTGKKLEFKSMRLAAEHFGIDRSVLSVRLRKETDYQGWYFKELDIQ